MKGKKTQTQAIVATEHGIYFIPKFFVNSSGKVNFIAAAILNFMNWSSNKGNKQKFLPVSFMPGMNCNLCCDYCYQRVSSTSVLEKPRFKRIEDYPAPLIKFITQHAKRLNVDRVNLSVLGGEPLLYTEQLIHFIEELNKAIKISNLAMITNGTLLNQEVLTKLTNNGLNYIQFTFDGGEEVHDQTRIYPNGNGSYHKVLDALQLALNNNVNCNARINLTPDNLDSVFSLIEQLKDLENASKLSISFELVHSTDFYSIDSHVSNDFMKRFRELILKVKEYKLKLGLPGHNGMCLTCGNADDPRGIVITSDGNLYSCLDSAGQPGMQVGDCKHGYYLNRKNNWVRCGKSVDSDTRFNFILETFATYIDG